MLILNAFMQSVNLDFRGQLPEPANGMQGYVATRAKIGKATLARMETAGYNLLDGQVLCKREAKGQTYYILAFERSREPTSDELTLSAPPKPPQSAFYAWDNGLGLISDDELLFPCYSKSPSRVASGSAPVVISSGSVYDNFMVFLKGRYRPAPEFGALSLLLHNPSTLLLLTERLMLATRRIYMHDGRLWVRPPLDGKTTDWIRMFRDDNANRNKKPKSHTDSAGRGGRELSKFLDTFTSAEALGMGWCCEQDHLERLREAYPDRPYQTFRKDEKAAMWRDGVVRYCTDVLIDLCAYVIHGIDPFASMSRGHRTELSMYKMRVLHSMDARKEAITHALMERSDTLGRPYNKLLLSPKQGTWAAKDADKERDMHARGMLRYDPARYSDPVVYDIRLHKDFDWHKRVGHTKICAEMLKQANSGIDTTPVRYTGTEAENSIFNGTRYQDRLGSDPWEDALKAAIYRIDYENWWWRTRTTEQIHIAYQTHKVIETVCTLLCSAWPTDDMYKDILTMPTQQEMEKAGMMLMSVAKEEFRTYHK